MGLRDGLSLLRIVFEVKQFAVLIEHPTIAPHADLIAPMREKVPVLGRRSGRQKGLGKTLFWC